MSYMLFAVYQDDGDKASFIRDLVATDEVSAMAEAKKLLLECVDPHFVPYPVYSSYYNHVNKNTRLLSASIFNIQSKSVFDPIPLNDEATENANIALENVKREQKMRDFQKLGKELGLLVGD